MSRYFYKRDREEYSLGVYDAPPSLGNCKYCGNKMFRYGETVRWEDSYTDDICFCENCGWWEYMMREPWHATVYHGTLIDFGCEDAIVLSVKGLLEEIVTGRKEVQDVTPRQFEEIVYSYFRNTIHGSVELTLATRDGGYDLFCIDSNSGPFIVEAKRYQGKVGVSIVRALLGVMVYNDIKRGIIFHSSQLTGESRKFVEGIRTKKEWLLEERNTDDLMAWLKLSTRDFDPDYLWNHVKSLSLNGDRFAIPQAFFANPQAFDKTTGRGSGKE